MVENLIGRTPACSPWPLFAIWTSRASPSFRRQHGRHHNPVVQHGLIQRDRIFTVSVPRPPGQLVRVAQVIADNKGNVIRLDHNQFVTTNRQAAVELRVTIEAFGTDHKRQIVKAIEGEGFRPKLINAHL